MAILRVNCPHCPAEHVAFELTWEATFYRRPGVYNCAAICGACSKPICFIAVPMKPSNSSPLQLKGDIEPYYLVPEIWPTRAASFAPPHTPPSVAKRFLEGEDAFNRGNWNSAVAMYRSALDIATKAMEDVPKDVTFFKRLDWLHETHQITPDIRGWADHVRVEGNAALHDPEDFDEKDAKALRFFTEMFLRYVYELPGEVKAFREKINSEKKGT